MEHSLSPAEYEEWLWSLECDPPAAAVLRTTNALLAELLARYHNVNFHNRDSADPLLTGRDFLPDQGEDDADVDEDADDADDADVTAMAPLAAHPMMMPGGAHVGPGLGPRGHGAEIPTHIWAMFGDGAAPEPD